MTDQAAEALRLIEAHPLAVLVLALLVAVAWIARLFLQVRDEKERLLRVAYQAQARGEQLDDDTTLILRRHERRKEARR